MGPACVGHHANAEHAMYQRGIMDECCAGLEWGYNSIVRYEQNHDYWNHVGWLYLSSLDIGSVGWSHETHDLIWLHKPHDTEL